MLRRPLLIASLGNPGSAYRNTLHSAGHTFVAALATHLAYPPFSNSRAHASGLLSQGQDAALWQSPTYMNLSGPAVRTAWRSFLAGLEPEALRQRARLVVVHDELEGKLGQLKLRKGGSSRGHKGIKSCEASLAGMEYWRLGVGIGRPESREPSVVAGYVLRKMTPTELQSIVARVDEAATLLGKLVEER